MLARKGGGVSQRAAASRVHANLPRAMIESAKIHRTSNPTYVSFNRPTPSSLREPRLQLGRVGLHLAYLLSKLQVVLHNLNQTGKIKRKQDGEGGGNGRGGGEVTGAGTMGIK